MKKTLFKFFQFVVKKFSGTGVGKIPGSMAVYGFIFRTTKPHGIALITCRGNKMYIPADDTSLAPGLLAKGVYEPFETELLEKLIKKDMTVVNIGANIGYYALIAANRVGQNGKVYAFEPEPNNYKFLVRNIEINGYKNIAPIQAAVSDKKGILKLFLDRSNVGNPSLAEQNIVEKNGFVKIETNSLDNFIEKYDKDLKVDVLIMDTQGAEGLILDGAKKILGRNRGLLIVMEFWPYGLHNMGTDAIGLLKKVEDLGFKIEVIEEENKRIRFVPSEQIVAMLRSKKEGKGFANLVLMRHEGIVKKGNA